jgi:hypothetical protein
MLRLKHKAQHKKNKKAQHKAQHKKNKKAQHKAQKTKKTFFIAIK